MRPILLLLSIFPYWLLAQEHRVPAGSEGNRLALAIENASDSVLYDLHVIIHTAPEWVIFNPLSVRIDSIASRAWQEAVFEFAIPEAAGDLVDNVLLEVFDNAGRILGNREIKLRVDSPAQRIGSLQLYPNPANPGATIQFALSSPSHIKMTIYNTLGQRVRTLSEEDRPAGISRVIWDGKNDRGIPVASGVYFVRLHMADKNTKQVRQLTSKLLIKR
jgi:hypothetical protein